MIEGEKFRKKGGDNKKEPSLQTIEEVKKIVNEPLKLVDEKDFKEAFNRLDEIKKNLKIFGKDQPPSSRAELKSLFKIVNEKITQIREKWANYLEKKGEEFIKEGKIDTALPYFQEALNKDPREVKRWLNLANLSIALGEYEKAHKILKEGAQYFSQKPEGKQKIYFALGEFFSQISEYERAIACFGESLEINPENPEILLRLGQAYLGSQIGDPVVNIQKAIKYFEKAKENAEKGKFNPTILSMIEYAKGEAFFYSAQMRGSEKTIEDYQKALQSVEEAIKKYEDNPGAWYYKGILLQILKEGKPEKWLSESLKCLQKVFDILDKQKAPKTQFTGEVWFQIAKIHYLKDIYNPFREEGERSKNLKECFICLENAREVWERLKISPRQEFVDFYYLIQEELKKTGQWEKFENVRKRNLSDPTDVMFR